MDILATATLLVAVAFLIGRIEGVTICKALGALSTIILLAVLVFWVWVIMLVVGVFLTAFSIIL